MANESAGRRIAGLSQLRDQPRALASRCRGGLTVGECVVLDALAGPSPSL